MPIIKRLLSLRRRKKALPVEETQPIRYFAYESRTEDPEQPDVAGTAATTLAKATTSDSSSRSALPNPVFDSIVSSSQEERDVDENSRFGKSFRPRNRRKICLEKPSHRSHPHPAQRRASRPLRPGCYDPRMIPVRHPKSSSLTPRLIQYLLPDQSKKEEQEDGDDDDKKVGSFWTRNVFSHHLIAPFQNDKNKTKNIKHHKNQIKRDGELFERRVGKVRWGDCLGVERNLCFRSLSHASFHSSCRYGATQYKMALGGSETVRVSWLVGRAKLTTTSFRIWP